MKRSVREYSALLLIIVMIVGVCTLFSVRKQGMFIDEIYTYGLSNGYYTPFITDANGSDEAIGSVITREQFNDYLTVGEDDGFAVGSVYYNQAADVHPPLYYWLFNFTSSVFRGGFTKWTGLALDAVIFALALFVLYKLCMELFDSRSAASAAVALYGLSHMGLSTMLMIRMYVLLTLLTLLLALFVVRVIKGRGIIYSVLSGLAILAGLMTQYYFVFYAFFLCLCCCIFLLFKKRYKDMLIFAISALVGVGALFIVFPPFVDQLFGTSIVSGGSAVDNLKSVSQYASRLKTFVSALIHGLKAVIITTLGVIILCLLFCKKILASLRRGESELTALLLVIPAALTFILVAVISPVDEARYVYNIAPIFVLGTVWLMYLLEKQLDGRIVTAALIAVACLSLWVIRTSPPDYLYPEHAEYDSAVADYVSSPCVYFMDDEPGHLGPITQDVLQLRFFEDVFIAEDEFTPALSEYITDHGSNDTLVIYISTSGFWGSGYAPEDIIELVCSDTDYTHAERLYNYGLSDTYVLTK